MSTMEEEFQARYGTQRIESDEDDELLGSRDGGDDKIDYDDVIMTSSKCEGIRGSPPTGIREQMVDYQYNEHELDYDEMLDTEQGRPNPPSRKHQQGKEVSDEEDEVKVHVTDDIEGGEAGEPSSGEEGEIKESGEEDNANQSTLSSVNLYGGPGSANTPPSPTPPTASTTTSSKVATVPMGEDKEEKEREEKAGDPVVKNETSVKQRHVSPSQRDSDGVVSPSPSPSPPPREKRSSGDKRSLKRRSGRRRREREEGEESNESVDSESDSDDSSDSHSRYRSDMSRHPRRERRRRSPVNAPPGGGDPQSKIPSVCRHFLNGRCSWGNNCRFLHEEPPEFKKPSPHERFDIPPRFPGPPIPHFPPGGPPPFEGFPHPMFIPPGHPDFMHPMIPPRPGMFPPHPPPPHHGRHPHHGMPIPPPFSPFPKGPKVSEVAEESQGWYRLRTVTEDWNSDEEESKTKKPSDDLRTVLKKKKKKPFGDEEGRGTKLGAEEKEGEGKPLKTVGSEEWTDPWARQTRTKYRRKKNGEKDSDEPSSESEVEEPEPSPPPKAKKRKKSKKVKAAKRIVEELSSLSESEEEPTPKKKAKKSKKLLTKKLKGRAKMEPQSTIGEESEQSSPPSPMPSYSSEGDNDIISERRGKRKKRRTSVSMMMLEEGGAGEPSPKKRRSKLSRAESSDVEVEKLKKKKKKSKRPPSPPGSPPSGAHDEFEEDYYRHMPHLPHHIPPPFFDRPPHPNFPPSDPYMPPGRGGGGRGPPYYPHHPHSPPPPSRHHLPPPPPQHHHHSRPHTSQPHHRHHPQDDDFSPPPQPSYHTPPPPSQASSSSRRGHMTSSDSYGRSSSRRFDRKDKETRAPSPLQPYFWRESGKGRPTTPPEGPPLGSNFGMGRRHHAREKVVYSDERLPASPPLYEEQEYRRHKQLRQEQQKYRSSSGRRFGADAVFNEEGRLHSWNEDHMGMGDGGGEVEGRRHGSSEDRSRSLTPVAVMEEDWLLDEDEAPPPRAERKRGGHPHPPQWGAPGAEWSSGGRSKMYTGDREQRQRDERPGSRSSRENMYGGSHDNREKYAYQQNSQIMAKRKKSKTVSQY